MVTANVSRTLSHPLGSSSSARHSRGHIHIAKFFFGNIGLFTEDPGSGVFGIGRLLARDHFATGVCPGPDIRLGARLKMLL